MVVTSFGPGIQLHMFDAPLVYLDAPGVPWVHQVYNEVNEAPTLLYYISFDSSKHAQSESSDCFTSINQWDAD